MIRKFFLLLTMFGAATTLAACEQDTEPLNCIPGYHEEDGKCVEDDPICFAPQDYAEELTYQLVWSDEFDGDELDRSKWVYEVNGEGGGNNELQFYTDTNTEVSDGTLKIIARHEDYNGWEYTSSRITTQNKAAWKYGIIEIRAKIPSGLGTWSALWMMPLFSRYGGWPNSGELDIMEHVGYNENNIHGTIHTKIYNHKVGTQKGSNTTAFQDVTTAFHVYKIEWLPDRIDFYVDDDNFYTYDPHRYSSCPTSNVWPFNASFFLIMNIAVGGDWGGVNGVDPDDFPTSMEIDYVRVYQADELMDYDDHTED